MDYRNPMWELTVMGVCERLRGCLPAPPRPIVRCETFERADLAPHSAPGIFQTANLNLAT